MKKLLDKLGKLAKDTVDMQFSCYVGFAEIKDYNLDNVLEKLPYENFIVPYLTSQGWKRTLRDRSVYVYYKDVPILVFNFDKNKVYPVQWRGSPNSQAIIGALLDTKQTPLPGFEKPSLEIAIDLLAEQVEVKLRKEAEA